jgi:hypothetical protein
MPTGYEEDMFQIEKRKVELLRQLSETLKSINLSLKLISRRAIEEEEEEE